MTGPVSAEGRETYLLHLLAAASTYRDLDLGRLFEPLGLTVEKYRSMLTIYRFPGCTMKELAQFTFIDRTTLTRMIDQMLVQGLVTREHAVRDRRQVVLGLTSKGVAVGLQAVDLLTRANARAAGGLPAADLDVAISVLETVLGNLITDTERLHSVVNMRRPGSGAQGR